LQALPLAKANEWLCVSLGGFSSLVQMLILAIAMACTEYHDYTKHLKLAEGVATTTDPVSILQEIRADPSFDGAFSTPFEFAPHEIIDKFTDKIGYYSARLDTSNVKQTLCNLLHSGVLLLTSTHKPDNPLFDFFLLHVLTGTHETTEILLSPAGKEILPESTHQTVLRYLWAVTVTTYIMQLRPLIKPELIEAVQIESSEAAWKETVNLTLTGKKRFDQHVAKAVRAILVTEILRGNEDGFYAKAAYHFVSKHSNNAVYGGGVNDEPLDVRM
jgi:hypothetical protein